MARIYIGILPVGEDARAEVRNLRFGECSYGCDVHLLYAHEPDGPNFIPKMQAAAVRNISPGGGWALVVRNLLFTYDQVGELIANTPSPRAGPCTPPRPFWEGEQMNPGVLSTITVQALRLAYPSIPEPPPAQTPARGEPELAMPNFGLEFDLNFMGRALATSQEFVPASSLHEMSSLQLLPVSEAGQLPGHWPPLRALGAEMPTPIGAERRMANQESAACPSNPSPLHKSSSAQGKTRLRHSRGSESSTGLEKNFSSPLVKQVYAVMRTHIEQHPEGVPSFSSRARRDIEKQKNYVRSVYGYNESLETSVITEVCHLLASDEA